MELNMQRKPRTYKITDEDYQRAMQRAEKEKVPLATMIEEILVAYGDGAYSVTFKKKKKTNLSQ
jgi:hypothetical protein